MAILTTIGDKFKNICFIGLDRVEYFHEKSKEAVTADSWQDVTDEQSRKNLALIFFSPRDLDGDHINPYIYLSESPDDEIDEISLSNSQQLLQNIPLIDMCRISKGSANTVNVLAVADIIFHWDVNDSYIQPTTPLNWIKDLKQIKSTYPKSTKFNIYTNWDKEKLLELKIRSKTIQQLPLDSYAWLNMPTFQEKYGTLTFILSIFIAIGAYTATYYQDEELSRLSKEIQIVEQEAPNNSKYSELAKKVTSQEAYMQYRSLIPVAFRDVASSIFHSGVQVESFEIRGTKQRQPIVNILATIKIKPKTYEGWIQEEPIAKEVIIQSVAMEAIRKPSGNKFRLEALISLPRLEEKLNKYKDELNAAKKEIAPLNEINVENIQ